MTTAATIISIIFRLANFGVLVGLCGYLMYARLLPLLRERVRQKQAALIDLQQQVEAGKQAVLDAQAKHQEAREAAARLLLQVERWAAVVKQEQQEYEQRKKARAVQMGIMVRHKGERMMHEQVKNNVMRRALSQARDHVRSTMHADGGAQYMNRLVAEIASMNQSNEQLP